MPNKNKMLITYSGGKYNLLPRLFELFPYHENFLELFGGSGCVILNKIPCDGREVYNDINGDIANLFKVISDESLFSSFVGRVKYLPPVGKDQFLDYQRRLLSGELKAVERAIATFYILNTSFSARGKYVGRRPGKETQKNF